MRGEILTYDDGPGTGLISGDDGVRYPFARADLGQLTPLRAGQRVDFVPLDGRATEVIVVGAAPATAMPGVSASIDWKKLFFDANGRIGQKDYWIGFAATFVAGLVLSWLPLIGTIISLVLIYCGVCIASKRLHDMGKSGWLAALPYGFYALATVLSAFSFIGGMASAANGADLGMAASMGFVGLLWMLTFVLNIGFVIWLGVTAGQPGDNAYGPPPQPLARF